MYQYVFTCCGQAPVYEKKTLDEDFSSWKCPECQKPVTKKQLYKIGKKEKDVLKVLYDYRKDGPYKGLKGLETEPK